MKRMELTTIAEFGHRCFVGPAALITAAAELAIAHSIRPQAFGMPKRHPAMLEAIAKAPRDARKMDRL